MKIEKNRTCEVQFSKQGHFWVTLMIFFNFNISPFKRSPIFDQTPQTTQRSELALKNGVGKLPTKHQILGTLPKKKIKN